VVLLQGYAQRCYHNGTNLYAAGDPFVPATSVTAGSAWTSFTPTLRFGGGSTGITYTTQLGRYTRVGNLVAFNIVLILTSKGSSTGSATIAGLPVSASGTANGFQVGYVRINFGTFTGTSDYYIDPASPTVLNLDVNNNGATLQLADTNFTNTTTVFISGTYFT
jgi:hypothetical protein